MYTRHIATTHRNDASHSALRLCLFLLAGFIDTSPAFAEPDMALLAQMQPGSGNELAIEFQGLQIERDQIKGVTRTIIDYETLPLPFEEEAAAASLRHAS